ncbi:MAG: hypothetical protein AAF252_07025 [Pseudomonadota bacterium]
MPLTAFFLICMILVPLALQLRGRPPAELFASAALIHAVFAIFAITQAHLLALDQQGQGPARLGLFYVLGHIRIPTNLAFVMMICAGITWLQRHFDIMLFPAATKVLFWTFHLSLLVSGTYVANVVMWRVDPVEHVSFVNFLWNLSSLTTAASYGVAWSLIALVGLTIWSAFEFLRSKVFS